MNKPNGVPSGGIDGMIQGGSSLDAGRTAREEVVNVDIGVVGDAVNAVKDKIDDATGLLELVSQTPPADFLGVIDGTQYEAPPVNAPASIDAQKI
ncbi:MAG TPA: hypothetical protein PKV72_06235 [Candidatus Peribacteria bacterium]|nr:hypothetical protein [Candidatus Peribacteria bacterium]